MTPYKSSTVSKIRSKTLWLGHIIHDIKRLGSCMQFCRFSQTCRGIDRLAHSLARRVVLAVDTNVWLEELPQVLDDVFQFDLP